MNPSPQSPLTSCVVRPGCKVLKLDATKAKKPRFPFVQKKAKDRVNTLEHLRRVGRVSMIQIGDDEFRTPNRAERRRAGIRHGQRNVLALIGAKRGIAALRSPIAVTPRPQLAPRTYTRKAKGRRKTIAERNMWIEASYEFAALIRLVHRARGQVGFPAMFADFDGVPYVGTV